ncbi:hypothetical protein BB560_003205 [Smittium megazygosporum]|uniref:Uncharacterized protein n=1 Tax=Smittium megazygosporum TaxID=133381 RepID=A0A2T9ZCL5_9FUNG|nr:hypothetical protein BB560_003205 [Smittium megazygosporum]
MTMNNPFLLGGQWSKYAHMFFIFSGIQALLGCAFQIAYIVLVSKLNGNNSINNNKIFSGVLKSPPLLIRLGWTNFSGYIVTFCISTVAVLLKSDVIAVVSIVSDLVLMGMFSTIFFGVRSLTFLHDSSALLKGAPSKLGIELSFGIAIFLFVALFSGKIYLMSKKLRFEFGWLSYRALGANSTSRFNVGIGLRDQLNKIHILNRNLVDLEEIVDDFTYHPNNKSSNSVNTVSQNLDSAKDQDFNQGYIETPITEKGHSEDKRMSLESSIYSLKFNDPNKDDTDFKNYENGLTAPHNIFNSNYPHIPSNFRFTDSPSSQKSLASKASTTTKRLMQFLSSSKFNTSISSQFFFSFSSSPKTPANGSNDFSKSYLNSKSKYSSNIPIYSKTPNSHFSNSLSISSDKPYRPENVFNDLSLSNLDLPKDTNIDEQRLNSIPFNRALKNKILDNALKSKTAKRTNNTEQVSQISSDLKKAVQSIDPNTNKEAEFVAPLVQILNLRKKRSSGPKLLPLNDEKSASPALAKLDNTKNVVGVSGIAVLQDRNLSNKKIKFGPNPYNFSFTSISKSTEIDPDNTYPTTGSENKATQSTTKDYNSISTSPELFVSPASSLSKQSLKGISSNHDPQIAGEHIKSFEDVSSRANLGLTVSELCDINGVFDQSPSTRLHSPNTKQFPIYTRKPSPFPRI